MNQAFHARKMLACSTAQLWDVLTGQFDLIFDDGQVVHTNAREVLYSSHFWQFHRTYQNVPLLAKHHVQSVLKEKPLNNKTHIKLLESVYWDTIKYIGLTNPLQRDRALRMIYEITNQLYNDLTIRCEDYVVSVDILDLLELIDHQGLSALLDSCDGSRESLGKVYSGTIEILNTDPSLSENSVARSIRDTTANPNQILQIVSYRGYVSDVDSYIIPTPVMRNYTIGMRSAFNIIVESCSASRSLYYSETPLENAEYFARRLHLLCMGVERLHYGDCGSQKYLIWNIRPPTYDKKGREVYKGDLPNLLGNYYLNEETGQVEAITANHKHLIGTTVKLRNSINCTHHDKHGVCMVCFGRMSENVNPSGNLGHVSSTTMTKETTQSVMSIKHIDFCSVSDGLVIGGLAQGFLAVDSDGTGYLIKKDVAIRTRMRLTLTPESCFGLTDINLVDDVRHINISRVSSVDVIGVVQNIQGLDINTPIVVSQARRNAMLTSDFLRYLKAKGWETDGAGNFIFDLTEWDFTKTVFKLPEMEYSFSQHSDQVAVMIESKMKDLQDRLKTESPSSTLTELFDLVNSKLSVNLSLLGVVVYSSMIADGRNDNFEMARNQENSSLGVAEMTIRHRSMSAVYAYEYQASQIINPRSFYKENRPDSLFDTFICPQEVVTAYKGLDFRQ